MVVTNEPAELILYHTDPPKSRSRPVANGEFAFKLHCEFTKYTYTRLWQISKWFRTLSGVGGGGRLC